MLILYPCKNVRTGGGTPRVCRCAPRVWSGTQGLELCSVHPGSGAVHQGSGAVQHPGFGAIAKLALALGLYFLRYARFRRKTRKKGLHY